MAGEGLASYPSTRRVGDLTVTLRLMMRDDKAAVLSFARALPQHDLMFLRRDITRDSDVEAWLAETESGESITILALDSDEIVGYAAVHRSLIPWSLHVAELRILTAERVRGKGMGRVLTEEAFNLALSLGLEKMVAQMTLDQKGAISSFESLGFRPEALLRDHVKDREGNRHDLLVLSHDVQRFSAENVSAGA